MFNLEGLLRKQLRDAMTSKQTLIFPEGEDPRLIRAASKLLKFANIILVGDPDKIRAEVTAGRAELECSQKRFFTMVRMVDNRTEPIRQELIELLCQLSSGKRWEVDAAGAAAQLDDPVLFAILAVRAGYADAVLGGLAHASRDFFIPCLRLLEREGAVYEMALFALPDDHRQGIYDHNLVMFADVALTPVPSAEQLAEIAVGACRTLRDLIPEEVLPVVNGALLSYSTRGSGQGPSVERIRDAEPLISERLAAVKAISSRYDSLNIITEMQISVAVSESAAKDKLGEHFEELAGAGKANVLIVPTLDVGNLLYHIYRTRYPDAQATLIIGGLRNQALDFSRSSGAEDVARGAKALLLRRFRSNRYARTPQDYFFPNYRILTINPGSTSTKVALFDGEEFLARKSIEHSRSELEGCASLADQLPLRRKVVEDFLTDALMDVTDLHAVVGRGGLLKPIESGTYAVDDALVADLEAGVSGEHPSNLGGLIARELGDSAGIPSFVVDPPVVDELDETSRVTGHPCSEQEAAWHALSQKAAAKHFADLRNREYEELNLIVGHLGGGISVGAHRLGRCVKVRNALYDGPLTPNRAGSLPGGDLIELCFSGIDRAEVTRRLVKQGGLIAYLGTNDLREVETRIDAGDAQAKTIFDAMCEQIAAEVASLVPKFHGEAVDRIILTGGLCHSGRLRRRLHHDLRPLGIKMTFIPGEREMEALRDGALRVLRGIEEPKAYRPLREKL